MKNQLIITLFGLLLLAAACQKSEYYTEGDFYYLSHKGAKLPVWVKGNMESDVMLIFVHGGPGDSGLTFTITSGFNMLEEDYMIVYWDQRFSGMDQGNSDFADMHPDVFIEDTEKLVQLIQNKYPGKKLFMMGHSWGGQLSAGYLGRDNHASAFHGWIDLDGSIYAEMEAQLMKEYILERVPAKLAEPGADKAFWQDIIDWYEENPNPGNYTDFEPYWYVSALGGDVYDHETYNEKLDIPYVDLLFKSMFSLSYYQYSFGDPEDIKEWDDIDYTEEIGNMTIPALLLWGANDGVVPVKVADYVYEHLGTDPSEKEVVLIPECGHGPHVEHPELFYAEVSAFIETYKNN